MKPGVAFGELAILYNCSRTATTQAITRTKVRNKKGVDYCTDNLQVALKTYIDTGLDSRSQCISWNYDENWNCAPKWTTAFLEKVNSIIILFRVIYFSLPPMQHFIIQKIFRQGAFKNSKCTARGRWSCTTKCSISILNNSLLWLLCF